MELPLVALAEQHFDPQRIEDIPAEIKKELASLALDTASLRGATVAVTAGSRGIGDIDILLGTVGVKYNFVDARVKPYVGAGVGLVYWDVSERIAEGRGTEYFFRGKAGVGVEILEWLDFFVEGSYRYVPEEVTFQKKYQEQP